MNIKDLPTELQNKIFYYTAEHPCAKMIKDIYKYDVYEPLFFSADENGRLTMEDIKIPCNIFRIRNLKKITLSQSPISEIHWNNLITKIKKRKINLI
jgi:hypothetical protein